MSIVRVAARESLLSKAQVAEVLRELRIYHSEIDFISIYIKTVGDIDQKTSLRTLDKTDFFTREIDDLLLKGTCRVGIHSAKDLPEPLRKGLCIAALTRGVDSSDSLVLRSGETLQSMPSGAVIGTSSERREQMVKRLRGDFRFVDVRGTIHERLSLLQSSLDGIVIAEAALIRLGLTYLNRIKLVGETVPNQGRLAVIVREGDNAMMDLFSCIDARLECGRFV